MGIKLLNTFLAQMCPNELRRTTLAAAKGKTITVDVSIYMYEFARQQIPFLDGFQQMLHLFSLYKIQPIFIFDGEPPKEKRAVIQKRAEKRKQAADDYMALKADVEAGRSINAAVVCQDTSDIEIDDLVPMDGVNSVTANTEETTNAEENAAVVEKALEKLRAQSVSVSPSQFHKVRQWLKAAGHACKIADGEADVLCAHLVKTGEAWGCMSNDTDMFVYGCARVISGVCWFDPPVEPENVEDADINQTNPAPKPKIKPKTKRPRKAGDCVCIQLDKILARLQMNYFSFVQMLVLAGTDYHEHLSIGIHRLYRLWSKYNDYMKKYMFKNGPVVPFGVWVQKYTQLDDGHNGELFRAHLQTFAAIINEYRAEEGKPRTPSLP